MNGAPDQRVEFFPTLKTFIAKLRPSKKNPLLKDSIENDDLDYPCLFKIIHQRVLIKSKKINQL